MTSNYPACAHTHRSSPDIEITNEIVEAIGMDYRTLPMFEKGLHEYTYKKHYSIHGNEYLRCRWAEYKRNIESRVFAPFQFLDIRDYHFVNCRNRLQPSESIFSKSDFRMKLKPGPGVDFRGQVPIPQELMMKRSGNKHPQVNRKEESSKENASNTKKES